MPVYDLVDADDTPLVEGSGGPQLTEGLLSNVPRALYLYENVGLPEPTVAARALYAYENIGMQAQEVVARALYLYENIAIQALAILARSIYVFKTTRDARVFPWLMKIRPTAQYPGGQVSLYGDGFGDLVEVGSGAALSASSGSPANLVDRAAASNWLPAEGGGSWVRFTFGAPRTLTQIALEGAAGHDWGNPVFRFSDGGPDIAGLAPGVNAGTAEVPVGSNRTLYTFAPRTCTWMEIRTSGAGQGLCEAWIWASEEQNADASAVYLGLMGGSREAMGVVSWASRSPGLWPADAMSSIEPAVVVTVPVDAESDFVQVEETGSATP